MKYIHMIGSHVTKSARTPRLIDRIVEKVKIPVQTKLIEIKSKEEFILYTNSIRHDSEVIGSFITNPWKEILEICREDGLVQTEEADICNAYNLILRENHGLPKVFNTDKIALVEIINNYNCDHVTIIGNGAMARLTRDILLSQNYRPNISIVCRSPKEKDEISLKDFDDIKNLVESSDLLINATPCGSPGFDRFPLLEMITHNNKNLRVLDYVHTHENNRLRERCLSIGVQYTSGIELNNKQAFYGLRILKIVSQLSTFEDFLGLISNEE